MEPETRTHPKLNEPAPDFRLAAAAGGEIGLRDFRDGKKVLLWFSKGLSCPFCRRNMTRLSQSYARFKAVETEILQVTINTIDEANLYFRNYHLATPYLCDADLQVHSRYGLALEPQSVAAVAENMVTSSLMVTGDLLLRAQKSPWPVPMIMRMGPRFQLPQLVIAVDRAGMVRHVQSIGPFDALPTVALLLSVLEPLH